MWATVIPCLSDRKADLRCTTSGMTINCIVISRPGVTQTKPLLLLIVVCVLVALLLAAGAQVQSDDDEESELAKINRKLNKLININRKVK